MFSLGLFQVIEPKVVWFSTDRGAVASTLIKLVLCYLLIGFTGGISSTYYVTLLLPVVSAATTLNPGGTALITALAIAAYISFLLLLDWSRYELTRFARGRTRHSRGVSAGSRVPDAATRRGESRRGKEIPGGCRAVGSGQPASAGSRSGDAAVRAAGGAWPVDRGPRPRASQSARHDAGVSRAAGEARERRKTRSPGNSPALFPPRWTGRIP